jgi:hypothetical protein
MSKRFNKVVLNSVLVGLLLALCGAGGCVSHPRQDNLDGFLTLGDDMGQSTLCDASSPAK